MAKVKFSAFVSDIRNKSNGSVFTKNRYGSVIRNKVTPVNPQTSFQQAARQSLANLSSSFRELTEDQIRGWNNSGQNFPFTDIFGDVKHLSGQTLFVKLNGNLEKVGSPRVLTAPAPAGFPEISLSFPSAVLSPTGELSLSVAVNPTSIPIGYVLVAYATPSLSRSKSFVKNQFRFLGVASVVTGEVDLSIIYSNRFETPLVDQVIHMRFALVNLTTGQQSIPVQTSITVEEA